MDHRSQVVEELRRQYDALTKRIAALDADLGHTLDAEQHVVLDERRAAVAGEREQVAAEIERTESAMRRTSSADTESRKSRIVEYDEMTRLIYELRADVTILKVQLGEHIARCQTEATSGLPAPILTVLAVGGLLTLVLAVFVIARYFLP